MIPPCHINLTLGQPNQALQKCVHQRRATERVLSERESSLGRPWGPATQAERCVALRFQYGDRINNFWLAQYRVLPYSSHVYCSVFDCSIDQIKCFSILINVIYAHNGTHIEIEKREKNIRRALAIVQLIFIPSRVWSSARILERTSGKSVCQVRSS